MDQSRMLLRGNIVGPEGISLAKSYLELTGASISYIGCAQPACPGETVLYDFENFFICPGFIDLHVHGAGGADVMDGSRAGLDLIANQLAAGGTTSFLATTMSADPDHLIRVVRSAVNYAGGRGNGSRLIGVHLEGPFLNPVFRGAHSTKFLRSPNVPELQRYIEAGQGIVKMVTMAPELSGSADVLDFAKSQGLVISIGHSSAAYDQVPELINRGVTHATHVFNAMAGFHHRDPGTVGAVLDDDQLTVDVIADGCHVHPAGIRLLVKAKGINRVCVITDCTRAGGMGDGTFELGGQSVTVRDRRAVLNDGTIAGSTISMAEAVQTLVIEAGFSLPEAVQMVSTNPARVLQMDHLGVLGPGKSADITVLDANFRVIMTIVSGQVVYKRVN